MLIEPRTELRFHRAEVLNSTNRIEHWTLKHKADLVAVTVKVFAL
jgi:hypothetical protein